jgi:hypothetical protein
MTQIHFRQATVDDVEPLARTVIECVDDSAAGAPHPVDDSSPGHISNLFVQRDLWGTGLAHDLHRVDDPALGLTMVEYRNRLGGR